MQLFSAKEWIVIVGSVACFMTWVAVGQALRALF
jgi:hypothetical protein